MDIPKHVEKMIERRAKAAENITDLDLMLAEWLENNDIYVEECDIHGGCEMYANPRDAADRIICAIRDK